MRRGRDSDNDLLMVGIRDADHEERRAERQASGGATKSLSGDERPMTDFVGGSTPIRHRRHLNSSFSDQRKKKGSGTDPQRII